MYFPNRRVFYSSSIICSTIVFFLFLKHFQHNHLFKRQSPLIQTATFTCFMSVLFSGRANVVLLEAVKLDKLGMGYRCVFTPISPSNLHVQWTVNGVDPQLYQSQFNIQHYESMDGVKQVSDLWIKNPVALRGSTEIKCSLKGVSNTFHYNSEI